MDAIFSVGGIADQYADSMVAQYAALNSNAIFNYNTAYNNAIMQSDETGTFVAPASVKIVDVDRAKLRAAFVEHWNNIADFDPAVALTFHFYSKPAPAPKPAVTAPTDPVGAEQGNRYYGVVPGDTTPAGGIQKNSRGVFVKLSFNTPFGAEVAYLKVQ